MASLDEPYLVTSYGLSASPSSSASAAALEQLEDHLPQLATTSVIYRESSKASKAGKQQSRRAVAVNTVQHNGIHLVDLSDQSPLAAFSVSPSTTFTSSALTISQAAVFSAAHYPQASTSAAATKVLLRTRKTFVGLERDGELSLCCWTEREAADGSTDGEPTLLSTAVSHPLLALTEHEGTILAFDSVGKVYLYDSQLQVLAEGSLSSFEGSIARVQVTSRAALVDAQSQPDRISDGKVQQLAVHIAVALPPKTDTDAVAPAGQKKPRRRPSSKKRLSTAGLSVAHYITYINVSNKTKMISEIGRLPLPTAMAVADMSGGHFAVITHTGCLESHLLSPSSLAELRSAPHSRVKAVELSTTADKVVPLAGTSLGLAHARLLRLPSHADQKPAHQARCVLLAVPRSFPSKVIDLSVWEIKLGLVLARKEVELPITVTAETLSELSLAHLSGGLAGLTTTPSPDASPDAPPSVAQRVLLHAVAFQASPSTTLSSIVGKEALTKPYLKGSHGQNVQSEGGNGKATASVVDLDTYRLLEQMEQYLSTEASARSVAEATSIFKSWLLQVDEGTSKVKPKAQLAKLSGPAVKRTVQLALSANNTTLPIAEGIMHDLIIHRKINNFVLSEDLAAHLLQRRHWRLVSACLRSLDDIPEETLVLILTSSIEDLPSRQPAADGPSFESILKLVVRAPHSPPILRHRLRRQLNPSDMRPIFETLDAWLVQELQSAVFDDGTSQSTPGSKHIVPFLQALLDAHLVAIMQSSVLHPLISELSRHLVQAISMSVTLEGLQAPLAVFSKNRADRARQSKETASADGFKSKEKRWQEKKSLQDTQLLLGDYAVESFQL